jgi:hypothetical protein
MDAVSDQVAVVGRELVLELRASEPDGDRLTYSFAADVPAIDERATMGLRPSGAGLFRWTPLASDVGEDWYFDFTVSDDDGSDTVTLRVSVRPDVGQNTAPIFREPLGTGTALDLETRDCLDLAVRVEDADSTAVELAQLEPAIRGATLTPGNDGLSAEWRWCPSARQIEDTDRYLLTLAADDGSHPPTLKSYLVVLRRPRKADCPGMPPVIAHVPVDQRRSSTSRWSPTSPTTRG